MKKYKTIDLCAGIGGGTKTVGTRTKTAKRERSARRRCGRRRRRYGARFRRSRYPSRQSRQRDRHVLRRQNGKLGLGCARSTVIEPDANRLPPVAGRHDPIPGGVAGTARQRSQGIGVVKSSLFVKSFENIFICSFHSVIVRKMGSFSEIRFPVSEHVPAIFNQMKLQLPNRTLLKPHATLPGSFKARSRSRRRT